MELFMMTESGFKESVAILEARGFSHEDACRFVSLIGDTPLLDENGKIIVEDDDGRILAVIDPF